MRAQPHSTYRTIFIQVTDPPIPTPLSIAIAIDTHACSSANAFMLFLLFPRSEPYGSFDSLRAPDLKKISIFAEAFFTGCQVEIVKGKSLKGAVAHCRKLKCEFVCNSGENNSLISSAADGSNSSSSPFDHKKHAWRIRSRYRFESIPIFRLLHPTPRARLSDSGFTPRTNSWGDQYLTGDILSDLAATKKERDTRREIIALAVTMAYVHVV